MSLFIPGVVEWQNEQKNVSCKENWLLDKFDGTFYLSYIHQDMGWFKTVSVILGILWLYIYNLVDVV